MSVGPLGLAAAVAGSPLAQTRGSEVERAQRDISNQQRQANNALRAEAAAGIGKADGEDHEAAERDADGRRLWEEEPRNAGTPSGSDSADASPHSKDTTGQAGNLLDLCG